MEAPSAPMAEVMRVHFSYGRRTHGRARSYGSQMRLREPRWRFPSATRQDVPAVVTKEGRPARGKGQQVTWAR
jgi:hypothetical protein